MIHLPDEILYTIFKYSINGTKQLMILQLVCKKFNILCLNNHLWYYTYKQMYPRWSQNIPFAHDKKPLIDWKQYMTTLSKQKDYIFSKLEFEPWMSSICSRNTFASDIDPDTNTGFICHSEKKLDIYTYPEHKLIRSLEFRFQDKADFVKRWDIVCLQTLVFNHEKVRLLAVGLTSQSNDPNVPFAGSLACWRNILVYRLFDDGRTSCLANIKMREVLLDRGSFFFNTQSMASVSEWLDIVAPDKEHDLDYRGFLLFYGMSDIRRFKGHCQVISFDIRADEPDWDPSRTVYLWNIPSNSFVPLCEPTLPLYPAYNIVTHQLAGDTNCMGTFNSHKTRHLLSLGSSYGKDIILYDWRFGIKVGVLPMQHKALPWGLETVLATTGSRVLRENELMGPRMLILSTHDAEVYIKPFDITCLYQVNWNPFEHDTSYRETNVTAISRQYPSWWNKRTSRLAQLANHVYQDEITEFPYQMPETGDLKIFHTLYPPTDIIAYVIVNTLVYLLGESGFLFVMDTETTGVLNAIRVVEKGVEVLDMDVLGSHEILIKTETNWIKCTLPF